MTHINIKERASPAILTFCSKMFLMTYGSGHSRALQVPLIYQHYVSISCDIFGSQGVCLRIINLRQCWLVCVHALQCVIMWNTVSVVVRKSHIENAPQRIVMLIHSDIKDPVSPVSVSWNTPTELNRLQVYCFCQIQQRTGISGLLFFLSPQN